ncbi:MAG: hypothetical protein KF789_04530 [Bdellovibrionaceae bacterium]|nr:hypothetical protein [Pseudobdellovibrionaceae bacterium]
MKLNEKTIFLLDGIGAALSATANGLILPLFSERIGFSATNLRLLGLIGFLFAAYSLTCFLVVRRPKSHMLLAIILGNSLYCLLLLAIASLSSELSVWGRAYFIGEVAIIAGIVFLEAKVYRSSFRQKIGVTQD